MLVEILFEPASRRVLVAPGTTLLAASKMAGVDISTGCTRGQCGTDAVRVRSGLDTMLPAEDPERATLARMGLGPDYRLSCSAKVIAGLIIVSTDAF